MQELGRDRSRASRQKGGGIVVTLEEVMEAAQASMQQIIDKEAAQAERANEHKLQMFLIGDCYEQMAAEKVKNLSELHNA